MRLIEIAKGCCRDDCSTLPNGNGDFGSRGMFGMQCQSAVVPIRFRQKLVLKPDPPIAEKNWLVSWGGRVYPVYAVNHDGGIYFADESGFLVSFDGSQVTSLTLPGSLNKKVAQITKEFLDDGAISLQFQNEDGRKIGNHRCSSWESIETQVGTIGWDQQCRGASGMYTNEVRANGQNQVVALKQVLVPGVAAIVIAQRR